MCEQAVRTRVRTPGGWRGLQEFLIVDEGRGPIEAVEVAGLDGAEPTPEVLDALARAEAIVIGPSNPVISIGPILAIEGIRAAIAASAVPVVAVSPLVGGRAVKGPTDAFLESIGRQVSAAGVASLYEPLLDAMVVDQGDPDPAPTGIEVLACPTLMEGAGGRRALAERVLDFARALAPIGPADEARPA
jgi:LPPG:FO 2-phospho-L-lactate transferase